MPEPMRESGPDFVVAGSGPDATCSTTVRDAVLPISSSALAAVFLSGSGALPLKLFNMLASPCGLNVRNPSLCKPASNVTMSSGRSAVRDRHFWDPPSAVSYGSCPPSMRALQCTLGWDIKARDELRYSCTHTPNQSERSWIKAALGPDEWATSASADLWRR